MSGRDPIPNAQSYQGVRATTPPNLITANRDPGNSDKKYPLGTQWLNKVTQNLFFLVGTTAGLPVWESGANAMATPSVPGVVDLSTLAQLEAGTAPTGSVVPLANDVFTFVNSVAIAGGTLS